jgi:hypothetical protein
MMIQNLFVSILLIPLFLLTACAPAPATEQAAPGAEPTAAEPYYPLSTRTGLEEVDRVLEAVASDDQQELLSMVRFTEAKCTHAQGLGGPPKCREGEEEGTSMGVFPFLVGEGSYLRKDEMENWHEIDAAALYAVYEVSQDVHEEEYFPVGDYVIVLVDAENASPVALRVTEGGIVRVDYLYVPIPETLDALIQREASNVILGPRN